MFYKFVLFVFILLIPIDGLAETLTFAKFNSKITMPDGEDWSTVISSMDYDDGDYKSEVRLAYSSNDKYIVIYGVLESNLSGELSQEFISGFTDTVYYDTLKKGYIIRETRFFRNKDNMYHKLKYFRDVDGLYSTTVQYTYFTKKYLHALSITRVGENNFDEKDDEIISDIFGSFIVKDKLTGFEYN